MTVYFVNFVFPKFIHFSALGYLSFALCVRSLKSWLKYFGASQTEGKGKSPHFLGIAEVED